jgi:tetratricopeptide (TPR) repeat protein
VLLIAWTIFQPLRSANADAAALTAATNGDTRAAIADARAAAREDSVSVDPLFELAAFYHASGDDQAAIRELDRAISRQPENPATWYQKAQFLAQLHQLRAALAPLQRAAELDRDYAAVSLPILRHELALQSAPAR